MHNLDKIGNLIIRLVDEIEERHHQKVYLTKLLKLLFLIDETAVKETGAPVTELEYRVWKMGPVALEVYQDLMYNKSEKLSFFAEAKKKSDDDRTEIQSVNTFDDGEFSDYEMELVDRIINAYGSLSGDELVNLLHEQGSLWKSIVDEKKLEDVFKKENTTKYKIDLSELIKDDARKLEIYRTAKESSNL